MNFLLHYAIIFYINLKQLAPFLQVIYLGKLEGFSKFCNSAQANVLIAINIILYAFSSIISKIRRVLRPIPPLISGKQLKECPYGMKDFCNGLIPWELCSWVLCYFETVSLPIKIHEIAHKNNVAGTWFLLTGLWIYQISYHTSISFWSIVLRSIYNSSCFHSGLPFKFEILCCCPFKVLNHAILAFILWKQLFQVLLQELLLWKLSSWANVTDLDLNFTHFPFLATIGLKARLDGCKLSKTTSISITVAI